MLSPGTVIGNWRVEAWAGRGVYGTVYRAVPLHHEHASPVALKLALLPVDPRFAHEAELLSRFDHPSIPRLLDHGAWQAPGGTFHPFRYRSTPADDLYALGVTACRLLTGEYPESRDALLGRSHPRVSPCKDLYPCHLRRRNPLKRLPLRPMKKPR